MFSLAVFSQDARKPISNDDVLALVGSGITEEEVILAIRGSKPAFDTSTGAIIGLFKKGVTPRVLEAMICSQSDADSDYTKSCGKDASPPGDLECVPGSAPNEVARIEGGERIAMKRSQTFSRYTGVSIFRKTRFFIYLKGERSLFRTRETMPSFEANLRSDINPSERLQLVRLTSNSGRRQVEIADFKGIRDHNGIRSQSLVPTTVEMIGTREFEDGKTYTRYRISVAQPLRPGEYAFVPRNVFRDYYDFAVDP